MIYLISILISQLVYAAPSGPSAADISEARALKRVLESQAATVSEAIRVMDQRPAWSERVKADAQAFLLSPSRQRTVYMDEYHNILKQRLQTVSGLGFHSEKPRNYMGGTKSGKPVYYGINTREELVKALETLQSDIAKLDTKSGPNLKTNIVQVKASLIARQTIAKTHFGHFIPKSKTPWASLLGAGGAAAIATTAGAPLIPSATIEALPAQEIAH